MTITSWQIEGEKWKQWQILFSWAPVSLQMVTAAMKLRRLFTLTNLDSILKSRDIILPTNVHIVRAMVFPVVMYGFESWTMKAWCFQIVMLEETLESPLDCKEIKPVNPKGNQPLIFFGRPDAEAEAPILWPPDAKSRLIGKDPDAGKDWGQEEKGATEDVMVGWHHLLKGHDFEQTLRDSGGQRSLAFCSPWGHKELDTA